MVSLITAGACLHETDWLHALVPTEEALLNLILRERRIPGPGTRGGTVSGDPVPGPALLSHQEVLGLVSAALNTVRYACWWLPCLIRAGLKPSLLLQPKM